MRKYLVLALLFGMSACGPGATTSKQMCKVAMRGAVTASDSVLVGDLMPYGVGQVSCRGYLR